MPTFKYKVNDRVKERNSNRIHGGFIKQQGTHKLVKARRGIVKGVNSKTSNSDSYSSINWIKGYCKN